ncbi:MAG: glycosyltransferase family 2 protein [Verrucomicrobia bacterium]|nr:glycosyltransferase family 2 protein [Verrucomicrobiota bacterium]
MPRSVRSKPGEPLREKLALLVPSFQHQRYLSQLLASICGQTRKPDEILISDDASADGSYELLKSWARGRPGVKIFRQTHNLGITGNSNFLLSKAKAKLVLFLHSDDALVSSRALEKMELLFRRESKLALVACGRRFLDEKMGLTGKEITLPSGRHAGRDVRRKILRSEANLIGEPSCVMFQRNLLTKGFDPDFRQLWDVDAWLRLLRKGDMGYVAEPLVGIRRHAKQATRQNMLEGRSLKEHLIVYGRLLAKESPGLSAKDRYRLLYKLTRTACRHPRAVTPEIRTILSEEKKRMGLLEYYRQKIQYRLGRWLARGSYQ